MNKTFYAIGMLLLIAYNEAAAQKNETALLANSSILSSSIGSADVSAAGVEVSAVASERFRKDFKGVKDVEWTSIKDGFRAYFRENDILTAVDYNKKGKLYSTIRYGKKLLPQDIAKKLDDTFGAPQIREVSEVKIADFATKVYIIVLEDATSMKTVQIMEDEMKVISVVKK